MTNVPARTNGNGNGRALAPHQAFQQRLQSQAVMEQIRLALPAHIKPERFARVLYTAVINEPKLLDCNHDAVLREGLKVAQLGLVTDPYLGEAYIIVGYPKGKPTPQMRVGYRGLVKLARQSGEISTVAAHAVHEFDHFDLSLGTDYRVEHKPELKGDPGAVYCYYAAVRFKDGGTDVEPMSIRKVHEIRERSDAWRAFKAGKIKSTPWSTDEEEMGRKTVLRRLCKRLPMSSDLALAMAYEDAMDAGKQANIKDGALEIEGDFTPVSDAIDMSNPFDAPPPPSSASEQGGADPARSTAPPEPSDGLAIPDFLDRNKGGPPKTRQVMDDETGEVFDEYVEPGS